MTLLLPTILAAVFLMSPIYAQTPENISRDFQNTDTGRRIAVVEEAVKEFSRGTVVSESRLTKVETEMAGVKWFLGLLLAGIIGQLWQGERLRRSMNK